GGDLHLRQCDAKGAGARIGDRQSGLGAFAEASTREQDGLRQTTGGVVGETAAGAAAVDLEGDDALLDDAGGVRSSGVLAVGEEIAASVALAGRGSGEGDVERLALTFGEGDREDIPDLGSIRIEADDVVMGRDE